MQAANSWPSTFLSYQLCSYSVVICRIVNIIMLSPGPKTPYKGRHLSGTGRLTCIATLPKGEYTLKIRLHRLYPSNILSPIFHLKTGLSGASIETTFPSRTRRYESKSQGHRPGCSRILLFKDKAVIRLCSCYKPRSQMEITWLLRVHFKGLESSQNSYTASQETLLRRDKLVLYQSRYDNV